MITMTESEMERHDAKVFARGVETGMRLLSLAQKLGKTVAMTLPLSVDYSPLEGQGELGENGAVD